MAADSSSPFPLRPLAFPRLQFLRDLLAALKKLDLTASEIFDLIRAGSALFANPSPEAVLAFLERILAAIEPASSVGQGRPSGMLGPQSMAPASEPLPPDRHEPLADVLYQLLRG
jgi:hypothetical protein